MNLLSGERGIRTPGPVTVNGFQDRRIRPLCHLSGAKVRFRHFHPKKKFFYFDNRAESAYYTAYPPSIHHLISSMQCSAQI